MSNLLAQLFSSADTLKRKARGLFQDPMGTIALGSQRIGGSEILGRRGLTGIRYLDGGSRGAGQGSSNFVVFPGQEDILKILERNGVPIK